jgi:hypothetical protein
VWKASTLLGARPAPGSAPRIHLAREAFLADVSSTLPSCVRIPRRLEYRDRCLPEDQVGRRCARIAVSKSAKAYKLDKVSGQSAPTCPASADKRRNCLGGAWLSDC